MIVARQVASRSAGRDDPTCEVARGAHRAFPSRSETLFARERTPGQRGGAMSRDLPLHPNLDHLRKQAKELLHELQQHDPDAILADAQHALAREYGFASWPKLKAQVDAASMNRPRPNPFVGQWTAD